MGEKNPKKFNRVLRCFEKEKFCELFFSERDKIYFFFQFFFFCFGGFMCWKSLKVNAKIFFFPLGISFVFFSFRLVWAKKKKFFFFSIISANRKKALAGGLFKKFSGGTEKKKKTPHKKTKNFFFSYPKRPKFFLKKSCLGRKKNKSFPF